MYATVQQILEEAVPPIQSLFSFFWLCSAVPSLHFTRSAVLGRWGVVVVGGGRAVSPEPSGGNSNRDLVVLVVVIAF